jgi:hypothetical protein
MKLLVYFAQIRGNGPIKIGMSDDPIGRIQNLQQSCPFKINLLLAIPGGMLLERELHKEFEHCRIRGEWFRPVQELSARIKNFETSEGARGFWQPSKKLRQKIALKARQERLRASKK